MKICYVHNVIMTYKIPFLRAVSRMPGASVVAIGGRSHWPKSKFHRGLRHRGDPRVRSVNTLDVLLPRHEGREFHLFFSPGLIPALVEEEPDLIVGGVGNILNNVLLWRWSRRRSIPYVWHGIGSVYDRTTLLRRLADPMVSRFVKEASGGWAFNTRSKDYYVQRFGLAPERVAVIPNIVDDEIIRSRNRQVQTGEAEGQKRRAPLRVLFVGHLVPAKRVDLLIDAVQILGAEDVQVRLRIVGDGPSRKALEGQAREGANRNKIQFMGAKFDNVDEVFASSDVFVLPGLGGLAIHQAMCHGLPVVSTAGDGSGQDMIEDGRSGFLLKDDTSKEIATKIRILARDATLRAQMAERAKILVDQRFCIRAVCHEMARSLSLWGLIPGEVA